MQGAVDPPVVTDVFIIVIEDVQSAGCAMCIVRGPSGEERGAVRTSRQTVPLHAHSIPTRTAIAQSIAMIIATATMTEYAISIWRGGDCVAGVCIDQGLGFSLPKSTAIASSSAAIMLNKGIRMPSSVDIAKSRTVKGVTGH